MAQATRVRKRSTTTTPRRKTTAKKKTAARSRKKASVKLPTIPVEAVTRIQQGMREGVSIALLALAVYLMASLTSYNPGDPGWSHTGTHSAVSNIGGVAGAWFADITLYTLGFASYALPFLAAYGAWALFNGRRARPGQMHFTIIRLFGAILFVGSACGLATIHATPDASVLPLGATGGGVVGTWLGVNLLPVLKTLGATLLLISVLMMSFTLTTGMSWFWVLDTVGGWTLRGTEWLGRQVLALTDEVKEWWSVQSEGIREARDELAAAREIEYAEQTRLAEIQQKEAAKQAAIDAKTVAKQQKLDLAQKAKAAPEPVATAPEKPARLSRAEKKALKEQEKADKAREKAAAIAASMPLADTGFVQEPPAPVDEPTPEPVVEPEPEPLVIVKPEPVSRKAEPEPEEAVEVEAFDADPVDSDTDANGEDSDLLAEMFAKNPEEDEPLDGTSAFKPVIGVKAGPITQRAVPRVPSAGQGNQIPPLDLLDEPKIVEGGYSEETLSAMSRLLEEKFESFKVKLKVVAVHPGPVVTRFEVQLAPGVKGSRITTLGTDIARSLSVQSVRVVEVITGKTTVGIEVPNAKREMVQLSEILYSEKYDDAKSPLAIGLGKDIAGLPVVTDLAKMPHLLVAGTTGAGKSVAINVMLLSLLYKSSAEDVRLILIDPKMLEMNMYEGIPHLLTPVVTDMNEAANALRWAVAEMERRYKVMAGLSVRNVAGFNQKIKDAAERGETIPDPTWKLDESGLDPTTEAPALEKMPYIVIVIDEFADMIMVVGKKVEELIARIAQKARAAGIHLVLATQRPSTDVITGLIKANIPGRISCRVNSAIDSRTILDSKGAETLLGMGDMLMVPPGTSSLERVHCAFVDDHEVQAVCDYLKNNFGSDYYEEILQQSIALPGIPSDDPESEDAEQDALYDQAVQIVLDTRKASISGVQRQLRIGYNRSARLIEAMEAAGIVTPVGTNGQRQVIAPNH